MQSHPCNIWTERILYTLLWSVQPCDNCMHSCCWNYFQPLLLALRAQAVMLCAASATPADFTPTLHKPALLFNSTLPGPDSY